MAATLGHREAAAAHARDASDRDATAAAAVALLLQPQQAQQLRGEVALEQAARREDAERNRRAAQPAEPEGYVRSSFPPFPSFPSLPNRS